MAEDAVGAAPGNYWTLLENDRIRLLEYTGGPGDIIAMDHHPDVLAYPLTSGKFKFTLGSGDSFEVELAAGEPMFVEAQDHSTENTGSGDARILLVELK
jgi:hypothetical protein